MKLIPLSKGLFAKVDDEDFEYLNSFKWYAQAGGKRFYAATSYYDIKTQISYVYYMHRIIMKPLKNLTVDHINHDPLDNQKSNLRVCTGKQNLWNKDTSLNTKKSSKYKGVHARRNGFQATIRKGGKCYFLGDFKEEDEAAKAYDEKAKELFGEFASLNFNKNL